MNSKLLFTIALLTIIAVSALAYIFLESWDKDSLPSPRFYVGVTANGNVKETKNMIDKTKDLINLIVVENTDTMKDKNSLVEVCDYACNAGLSFLCTCMIQ